MSSRSTLRRLAVPAMAGGPLSAPDGVGNPSTADYTGYGVYAYVYGVKDTATPQAKPLASEYAEPGIRNTRCTR